jgi:hypothetical protein
MDQFCEHHDSVKARTARAIRAFSCREAIQSWPILARTRSTLLLQFNWLRRINLWRFDLYGRSCHWRCHRCDRCGRWRCHLRRFNFRGNGWSCRGCWCGLASVGLRRFDFDGGCCGWSYSGLTSVNLRCFNLTGAKFIWLDFASINLWCFNLDGRSGHWRNRLGVLSEHWARDDGGESSNGNDGLHGVVPQLATKPRRRGMRGHYAIEDEASLNRSFMLGSFVHADVRTGVVVGVRRSVHTGNQLWCRHRHLQHVHVFCTI